MKVWGMGSRKQKAKSGIKISLFQPLEGTDWANKALGLQILRLFSLSMLGWGLELASHYPHLIGFAKPCIGISRDWLFSAMITGSPSRHKSSVSTVSRSWFSRSLAQPAESGVENPL